METRVHAFEKAGLGKAPFRIVGVEERRGPITVGNATVGAPGQPMGCCKFCYTGIAECWIIQSADGKVFEVGNVCVGKTGDAGLKRALNRKKTEMRNEKTDKRIAAAYGVLDENQRVRVALATRASKRSVGSELEYVEFLRKCAGRSGLLRAARLIEAAAKIVESSEWSR